MSPQETLLKAAKRIHNRKDDFSCLAVAHVGGNNNPSLYGFAENDPFLLLAFTYARLASPDEKRVVTVMDVEDAVNASTWSIKARKFRVLLLLMVRAAWEDVPRDIRWDKAKRR